MSAFITDALTNKQNKLFRFDGLLTCALNTLRAHSDNTLNACTTHMSVFII